MFKCLIALTSLLSGAAVAVPAWTWVDEQGRQHFSDRPVEGATKIELSGGQTFSGAPGRAAAEQARSPVSEAKPQPAATEYTVLAFAAPTNQETVFNIEGNLEAEIVMYPPLEEGHVIDVILDGEHVAIGTRDFKFTVPEVWRGEHTMQAVVMGRDGRELKRSLPVTFYVRQNSIATPR